ncbi:protocatechuate 4,5-dioxygenase subunit alpha [Enterovibrio baiacu]|uniref:protocatechuate 4,5-dioxygenase subunit alpha n=1 Tax=Enterovibrio baiacu TaxID=2491023 RepID=UPI001013394C|nr:protocatechuate 4,5-dioxygenase subunit alpha [Enterovibrio baiacu]MBE1273847.1 protocatechuate 4,5-dioxygenase subunit alpha [Enterovibrio baiacu]
MREKRDYDDIPGTYVFDGQASRQGYHLNMFCMSLNKGENRDVFRQDEAAYLDKYPMTAAQREAVLTRDWLGMLRLGGNIYYTFKLAIFDGMTMQHAGAAMSGNDMTVDDFRDMMLAGGRGIDGNRSKQEWAEYYSKPENRAHYQGDANSDVARRAANKNKDDANG